METAKRSYPWHPTDVELYYGYEINSSLPPSDRFNEELQADHTTLSRLPNKILCEFLFPTMQAKLPPSLILRVFAS